MAPDALKSPPATLTEEVACSFSAPSSYKMQSTDSFQPLQLKGEVLDMEFTVDTDHRKRRRNRTTQSCLNCHTSKRKCDRKRPCQRCIQLGLTGLCVYEIDDPALRDDPSVDENTRLRNRIAELESLVRELRGKPHPRWAESTFGNGDPNEKWHSRAAKCQPLAKRRGHSPARLGLGDIRSQSALMSPVKSEPSGENGGLYRFTPSPTSGRYNGYDQQGQQQQPGFDGSYSNTPSTSPSVTYSNANGSGPLPSSYSDGGYNLSGSDDGNVYGSDQYNQNICSCRTNPATGLAYIGLAQQLQSSLSSLRQYSHHPSNTTCSLYRRIVDLDNAMQYVPVARSQTADQAHSSHLSGNEPTETHPLSANGFASALPDRDITTPLSASSGHGSFHTGSSAGVAPQEWNALAAAGYNPYFPVHTEHNLYQQVIT